MAVIASEAIPQLKDIANSMGFPRRLRLLGMTAIDRGIPTLRVHPMGKVGLQA